MNFLKKLFDFTIQYLVPFAGALLLGVASFLFGVREGSISQSQQDNILIRSCIYEYNELKAKVWEPQQETGMGFHFDQSCSDVCKLVSRPSVVFRISEAWATPNGKCSCVVESVE